MRSACDTKISNAETAVNVAGATIFDQMKKSGNLTRCCFLHLFIDAASTPSEQHPSSLFAVQNDCIVLIIISTTVARCALDGSCNESKLHCSFFV
jgi:hypothetical protein